MLTLAVCVVLEAGLLSEDAPRAAHLVEPAAPRKLESMSRSELQVLYDDLDAKRPGLLAPFGLIGVGAVGVIVSAVVFWVPFTTPYGLAVYAAVILVAAFIASLAMIATGIAVYVRNKPERDRLGQELRLIEDAYRQGRCRNVEGQRPCKNDPRGPPPAPVQPGQPVAPPQPGGGYVPQVLGPAPLPSLVLASF